MVTDPISDFLIRLQNASMAKKTEVSLPLSRMKLSIAEILQREGYLDVSHQLSSPLLRKQLRELVRSRRNSAEAVK